MSKVKVRCQTCGKWFQSANAKEVTCPECTQKARRDKLAAKSAPPGNSAAPGAPSRSVPPPPKPKPAGSGGTSHWIDAVDDVKVGQPDQSTRPRIPSYPAPRDNRGGQGQDRSFGGGARPQTPYRGGPGTYRDNDYRTPPGYRVGGGMGLPDTAEPRPRQPLGPGARRPPLPGAPGEGRPDRPRPGRPMGQRPNRPPAPPRPKKEKIPPPQPFSPSEEQVAQIEARYLELAVPHEFDGIRTQISKEINIPKSAVKKIVKALRDKMSMPSWWEVQAYTGTAEELEQIKAVYEPHLPVPPIGVHKQIAEQFSLKPGMVYQAIKQIRLDMSLPQFNDPEAHGEEFVELLKRKRKPAEQPEGETEKAGPEKSEEAVAAAASAAEHAEEPTAPSTAPAAESQGEPEGEQTPSLEIAERETGLSFEKVGDTTEIAAPSTTDATAGE